MDINIEHDAVGRRFSAEVDGHPCEIDYRLADGVMTITHTGVPSAVGGRGIAGQLTQRALETAREHGWKVVPACSYAEDFMRRHREFDDLRAGR